MRIFLVIVLVAVIIVTVFLLIGGDCVLTEKVNAIRKFKSMSPLSSSQKRALCTAYKDADLTEAEKKVLIELMDISVKLHDPVNAGDGQLQKAFQKKSDEAQSYPKLKALIPQIEQYAE